MNLTRHNIICLDLETLHSADDCRHCGRVEHAHGIYGLCRPDSQKFEKIGWDNKGALGLSIGCWFDYQASLFHWFDAHTLEATVRLFVERRPLLVSFNGISFDFVLMRALLRREAERLLAEEGAELLATGLVDLCDTFKTLCSTSYDILAEIWRADPGRKFERGLNSLGAISVFNGLGAKEMGGAMAPRLWAQGRYAEVMNYCQSDVEKTKGLFELICAGQPILRGDNLPITLPAPVLEGVFHG